MRAVQHLNNDFFLLYRIRSSLSIEENGLVTLIDFEIEKVISSAMSTKRQVTLKKVNDLEIIKFV